MQTQVFTALIASALFGFSSLTVAQTSGTPERVPGSPSYGDGGSPRCDAMSGEQKAQCLRDEATKTQGSTEQPASTGSSKASSETQQQYGQGGAARCATKNYSERDDCLKDEARKGNSTSGSNGGSSPTTTK
jgi:hypothetical protein